MTEQQTLRQRASRSGRPFNYLYTFLSLSLTVPPLPQPRLQPSTAHQHFRLPGLIFSHATFDRAYAHSGSKRNFLYPVLLPSATRVENVIWFDFLTENSNKTETAEIFESHPDDLFIYLNDSTPFTKMCTYINMKGSVNYGNQFQK